MNHIDPELIASLAGGDLDPEAAASAEREIAADPAAAAELEAQRAALAALRGLPAARLSDAERSMVRASVAGALGLAADWPAAPVPPIRRRRMPWPAIGIAAASLVAIVAIVPGLGLLSTGGDDGGDMAMTTVTLAGDDAPASDLPATVGGLEDADASTQAPAPGSRTTDDQAEAMLEATPESFDEPTTTMAGDPMAAAVALDPELVAVLEDPAALIERADDSIVACRDEAVAALGEELAPSLAAVAESLEGTGEVVIWFVATADEVRETAVFASTDCTLLALIG